MANYNQYEIDSAYAIQIILDEYYEYLKNIDCIDSPEETVFNLENEIQEGIEANFPTIVDKFDFIVELVHKGIEKNEFDFSEVEDIAISILNAIQLASERNSSWNKMDLLENESSATEFDNILQGSIFNEKYEDDNESEYIDILYEMAEEIYRYIVTRPQPVSKELIGSVFEGYSDRALALAVSRRDILNYRGLYFSTKYIGLTDDERNEIYNYVENILYKQEIIHIEDLYEPFVDEFYTSSARAFIKSPYQLFTFLECYIGKKMVFARPFISFDKTHIVTPQEYLQKFITNHEEFLVNDFVEHVKDKRIKINNILELIVSLNDKIILKDRETIIRIEKTGLSYEVAQNILESIKAELQHHRCMAIRDLTCISLFPFIDVEWDEWLIYSVIRKWLPEIETNTTSRKFRQSVPIIGLPGEITEEKISEIATRCSDLSYTPQNKLIESLDDIDDLILGYVDIDLDWGEDL